jgi:MFS family permease
MFLHDFLVSILPSMLENRLHLDPELIQNASLALLAESALVSFIVSPFIHHHADRFQNDSWLIAGLVGELLGSVVIAAADSCMTDPLIRLTLTDKNDSNATILRSLCAGGRKRKCRCSWVVQLITKGILGRVR